MSETINKEYTNLTADSFEFRRFVESMDKIPTEEIIARYELKTDIISYYSDLSKRQA